MTSPHSKISDSTVELSELTPEHLWQMATGKALILKDGLGLFICCKQGQVFSCCWQVRAFEPIRPYIFLAHFALLMERGFSHLGKMKVDESLHPLVEHEFEAEDKLGLYFDFLIWIERLRGFHMHLKREGDGDGLPSLLCKKKSSPFSGITVSEIEN